MTKHKFRFIITVLLLSLFTSSAFSQMDLRVKRTVATVIFSSLGGAVLGLSTLPFYGEPQEHANNITTGALIGLVAGISYVAYDSSTPKAAVRDYSQEDRWIIKPGEAKSVYVSSPVQIRWAFTF